MQIRVMETAVYRWLMFDDYLQSVMEKSRPWYPVLPHIHALLLAQYYQPLPRKVVELGLGGGSLARYFQHVAPAATFTSVELAPEVIDTYYHYFEPVPGHQIMQGDAATLVSTLCDIDILYVDLFNATSSPDFIFQAEFYQHCLQSLAPDGVLVVNVVPELQLESESVRDIINQAGQTPAQAFSVPGFKNRVFILPRHEEHKRIVYNDALQQLCLQRQINLNHIVQLR